LPNSQRKGNISGYPTDVTGSTTRALLINSFSLEESLQVSHQRFLQKIVETPDGSKKFYIQFLSYLATVLCTDGIHDVPLLGGSRLKYHSVPAARAAHSWC